MTLPHGLLSVVMVWYIYILFSLKMEGVVSFGSLVKSEGYDVIVKVVSLTQA